MLEKYIVCDACGLRSSSFESSSVLCITPTYTSFMQELIMQGMQQKWERSCFLCKKNTWHVESNYILQPPKYLITVLIDLDILTTILPKIDVPYLWIWLLCLVSIKYSLALAHHLHPIKIRSRSKRRNLWVGWCVSSWWPWFWPVYSIYYIHTIHYGCIISISWCGHAHVLDNLILLLFLVWFQVHFQFYKSVFSIS